MAYYFSEPSRTFGEYLLVPGYSSSECVPTAVSLRTPLVKYRKGEEECPLEMNIPMVSAIMQSVSGEKLAIALAKQGGVSFIYGSQTIEQEADMVRRVAANVFIPFTVGGGIRTVDDFRAILREGADKISINSSAINTPELVSDAADKFGSQCVVVAIDAKKRADGSGWNIYKNGGRIDVGIDAVEWAMKVEGLGAGEILLTSMDCDGTKAGYDLELTRTIAENVSIPVIASGGAGTLEHFKEALTAGKADAALAASLFHYKELEIRQVKEYLQVEGVPVRL